MNARQTIYNKIVEAILAGKINPGERLPEADLSREFNVSRTPVREALMQLERDGYITHVRDKGAFVKKLSGKQVEDFSDVIGVLEAHAAELATQNLTEEGLLELNSIYSEMEAIRNENNYLSYVGKNLEFHAFFLKHSGNEELQIIVSELRKRIYTLRYVGLTLPTHMNTYMASHKEILRAVAARDASRVRNLMLLHNDEIRNALVGLMGKLPSF